MVGLLLEVFGTYKRLDGFRGASTNEGSIEDSSSEKDPDNVSSEGDCEILKKDMGTPELFLALGDISSLRGLEADEILETTT